MELVECFHADTVAFLARLWMVDLQRGLGHAEFGNVGF